MPGIGGLRRAHVVVVVDSLQTWAETHREQAALMRTLRTLRPSFCLCALRDGISTLSRYSAA